MAQGIEASDFETEVRRLRDSGALGEGGRLRELFDFLANRGAQADAASQAEIAETVFGQTDTLADDATVRVYIHRLRKRLEDHYKDAGPGTGGAHLTVPSGTYALRLAKPEEAADSGNPAPPPGAAWRQRAWAVAAVALIALLGAYLLGRAEGTNAAEPPTNEFWEPFLASERPTLVVLGDYYIFGEIDPVRPEEGRLIRDFRVDSPTDLARMQALEPERYGNAEDVGLNYLPFSASYGLLDILPMLARDGRQVSVLPASELEPDMFNYFDVVYIGLFSGMGLLEDITFSGSRFELGESYDELIDNDSGESFVSEEARSLASPVVYRDYGFISRFRAPGGALVAVVAGARETGLRGLAPLAVSPELDDSVNPGPIDPGFEALFQTTGQQGADMAEKLILSRARQGAR